MSAPATRARRTIRAPPPTPIATGKGVRSAASNDRVLSEFLETSLRVPELTLPEPPFPPKSSFKVISLPSLVAGDPTSLRRMMKSASKIGAFLIDGCDLLRADEVRSAIEAARGAFEIREERRKEMREWFGRGDEFYWGENVGTVEEVVLQRAFPNGSYRIFREKMENVASKLKTVAETITQILSENIRHRSQPKRFHNMHSVLCLRKHDSSNRLKGDITEGHHAHILSLLIGDCNKSHVHSEEASSSFTLPAGFILVTIGKPFQKWSNGDLKAYSGEIFLESVEGQPASLSLEFMFSPLVLRQGPDDVTISLMDQLLIMLVLALLYNLFY